MTKEERLQDIVAQHSQGSSIRDAGFIRRVYSKGLSVYQARLEQYGFSGKDRVLDAGCGFGQWSLSLAQLNRQVSSCDMLPERVSFLKNIAHDLGLKNLDIRQGSLPSLPYEDESFDAVLCWGVIFLTPWRESLAELTRILKKGGRLYLNANGIGWYKFLWTSRHNESSDYDPRLQSARAFMNTWRYDRGEKPEVGDIIIDEQDCLSELSKLGYANVQLGDEGTLCAPGATRCSAPSFFQGSYGGDRGVYEVLAQRA